MCRIPLHLGSEANPRPPRELQDKTKAKYRTERKNRDAFRELLKEHGDKGKIATSSFWGDYAEKARFVRRTASGFEGWCFEWVCPRWMLVFSLWRGGCLSRASWNPTRSLLCCVASGGEGRSLHCPHCAARLHSSRLVR